MPVMPAAALNPDMPVMPDIPVMPWGKPEKPDIPVPAAPTEVGMLPVAEALDTAGGMPGNPAADMPAAIPAIPVMPANMDMLGALWQKQNKQSNLWHSTFCNSQ